MMDRKAKEIRESIERLLQSESTLVLSTVNAGSQTHATPLFYLPAPEFELYWFSSASSRHSRNLANRGVSVAIFAPTERWQEIRGVQMHGSADKVTDRTLRRELLRRYCERFRLGDVFRLTLTRNSLYRFRPTWIRYLDNSRHFGFKFEMAWPPRP